MQRFLPALFLAALPGLALAQAVPATMAEAGAGLLQVLLALGAVVAAIVGGLWLLKRVSAPHGAAAGVLRVVAGTAVGPRERIVLLEVEDTWLVVGVAPGQVSALHRMPKGTLAAAPAVAAGKDFGTWLKRVMERKHAR